MAFPASPSPITVVRLHAGASVEIDVRGPAQPTIGPASPVARAHWEALVASNPRVFDGRVLCASRRDADRVLSDAPQGTDLSLPASVQRFSRWVTSRFESEPLVLLSVTALVVASGDDASGVPRVLLGKRGEQVLHYPGQWEIGPSGGISPPERTPIVLGWHDLADGALGEVREEVGGALACRLTDPTAMFILDDRTCGSLDFVIRYRLDVGAGATIGLPGDSWEYADLALVPLDGVLRRASLSPAASALLAQSAIMS